MRQKPEEMIETLAHGFSFMSTQRELSNEYQHDRVKVEPYSIHGSFLKLEYLKTEFNEDSGTCASVKVAPHSYRIMVKKYCSQSYRKYARK